MKTPIKYVMFAVGLLVVLSVASFFTILPYLVAKEVNSFPPGSPQVSPEVKRLHQELLIADLHADSLLWNRDPLERETYGHVDIPRLREGNVALQAFTVVTKVPRDRSTEGGTSSDSLDLVTLLSISQWWPSPTWTSLKERALFQARRLHEAVALSNGRLVIIKSAQDLESYLKRRRSDPSVVGGFLGIEGAHALEGDVENLKVLFDAGFRMIGLTHHFDNEVGGSAHGEVQGGLSEFGRQVIERMEQLDMIVDLAHASAALIEDVLEIANGPVLVSHTGVKGTCDNQRNLTDDQISNIAATGGVIGIGYWQTAVCGIDVDSIVQALSYTIDRVGVDHVALGSDFDGFAATPFDTTGLIRITGALVDEGFSEEDIRKVMGENVLRVLDQGLPRE